ncbi:oxidoreductase [Asanoa ishikariensis]|uniref:Predicted dehydrogenase n=1 Tax=Asanoa ishikariensis TaxID=137265 RepID=A0A1H3UCD5_9ACTN|nr:Gfo/Idh/MocA family oxidoreductase [Asanoa ishikariensis]GIF63869.1 oxidoreductase [Asanoa ishikariensis]SDZ60006.1 Predicted dehydrogenase [Asanoa ishikariensis]
MLDALRPIAQACDLSIPQEHHRGIAVVGAGAIVEVAHLPAYQRAGLPVRGIVDLDRARAEKLAARFGLPRVYDSLDDVLADDEVEVLDVAVVPNAQPEIAKRAFAAGRHVLAQKPIAVDTTLGHDLVAAADAAGTALVVNQQMRYGEGIAATRAIAEAGWLGEVTALTIDVNITTDFTAWDWLVRSERLDLMYHSIHYYDSVRSLLGDPDSLYCVAGRRPGQAPTGETRSITTMTFPSGARALVNVNHENVTGDPYATFRLDGSQGSVRGSIGLLLDYPHGRPDTVAVRSAVLPTDGWLPYPVTTRWIPDAFAGPMGALLRQVAGTGAAPTRGADALRTLALVEAGYESIRTGEVTRLTW